MVKTFISLKKTKITLHPSNQINPGKKTCCKIMVQLVQIYICHSQVIKRSSYRAVLSWIYQCYKYFLVVETYDIFVATQNRFFKIPTKEFNNLFDYIFQEVEKIKLLNINIIQSEHGTSIDQTDNIIKNIIQEYWGTNATRWTEEQINITITSTQEIDNMILAKCWTESPLQGRPWLD